jgi:predicted ABC-type ATPase
MRPEMLVVAGPIASGKTGVFRERAVLPGIDAFNVDDECARLNHGSYQKLPPEVVGLAIERCERFIQHHIAQGRSFLVETTLRTVAALDQAARARRAGFTTRMFYVSTNDPETNVDRALAREAGGGREVEPDTVRSVYRVSLANLPRAIHEFDTVALYDNSQDLGVPTLQLETRCGRLHYRAANTEAWAGAALAASRPEPHRHVPRRR